jgi:ribosome biogenesis protein UTP30
MDTYAIFLADDRIIPTLPKLLGKQWLARKKQPLPVSLKPKSVKANLELALSSTRLYIPAGTSSVVRLGTVEAHSPDQLIANLEAVLPQLAIRIPEGWENLQSLHLKTSTSTALPIWNSAMPLIAPPPAEIDEDLEEMPEVEGDEEEIAAAIQESAKKDAQKASVVKGERKRARGAESSEPKRKAKAARKSV